MERMQRRIKKEKERSEMPMSQRRPQAKSLAAYERKASSLDAAITAAYASGGYTPKEIGDYYGLHYSGVRRILARANSKA